MAIVKYYGHIRTKTNQNIDIFNARDIKAVLEVISNKYNIPYSELKTSIILVNNKDIELLKKSRTKLKSDDVVMILSPCAGG